METQIAHTDFKKLAAKYLLEFNEHDAQALARLYSENAIMILSDPSKPLRGRREMEQLFINSFTAFPDIKLQFTAIFPSLDQVCFEFHETGTFTGPLSTTEGEVPPTGRKFDIMGAFILKLTDEGLISEDRSYFDQDLFQNQLGLTGKAEKEREEQEITKAEVADIKKEKAAVSYILDQFFDSYRDEKTEIFENILDDDPELLFFGTDTQERWIGKDVFMAAQKEFFKATSDAKIEIYNKTVQIAKSGNVAWTSCMTNLDIMSDGKPMRLEGLRLTSTFEKRDGKWVLVQGHASQPISGQMIAY
jgi:ketosteroid isomerase-like protein